jgi:hypothetical protein
MKRDRLSDIVRAIRHIKVRDSMLNTSFENMVIAIAKGASTMNHQLVILNRPTHRT